MGSPRHEPAFHLTAALLTAALVAASCAKPPESAPVIDQYRIQLPGTGLLLRSAGPADGPPILLLHGAMFSSAVWEELGTIPLLAQAGWRVLAVDLPGTNGQPAGDLPETEWVGAILDALKIPSAALLAPSLSGRAALSFVAAHPERVTQFIGVAPAGVAENLSKLQGSQVPALIIWSEDDKVIPIADGVQLAMAMPQARLFRMPGMHHPCYLGDTAGFHAALLEFLVRP